MCSKKKKGKDVSEERIHHDFLLGVVNDILESKDQKTPVDRLPGDLSLTDDIGLNSFDLAEMTVRVEDEYGVDVFEDEVIDTVGEVLSKIQNSQ
jgi:acyl carrier protein